MHLLKEIDKGISNRGAKVGLIITEVGEGRSLDAFDFFHEHGHRAIVDMDPINPDPYALKFAYLWARWQSLKDSAEVLDSEVVSQALASIKLAIGNVTSVKSNNTQAINLITSSTTIVGNLYTQIQIELERLERLMDDVAE
jgi:hypothetical protein